MLNKNNFFAFFMLSICFFGFTKESNAQSRAEIEQMVTAAAWAAGVPTNIAHAVIKMESGYQVRVRGAAAEYGLGQIMCPTAREVGFTGNCADLLDPQTNLRYSMKYLRLALDKGGATCAGVSLYNMGIHARPVCTRYGQVVMSNANSNGK